MLNKKKIKKNDSEKLLAFVEKNFKNELEIGYKSIGYIVLSMILEIEGKKGLNEYIRACKKGLNK